jgi:Transposase
VAGGGDPPAGLPPLRPGPAKGHRFRTVVADHDQGGRVVWAAEGRNSKVLEAFHDELDELDEAGRTALQAISLDLGRCLPEGHQHQVCGGITVQLPTAKWASTDRDVRLNDPIHPLPVKATRT